MKWFTGHHPFAKYSCDLIFMSNKRVFISVALVLMLKCSKCLQFRNNNSPAWHWASSNTGTIAGRCAAFTINSTFLPLLAVFAWSEQFCRNPWEAAEKVFDADSRFSPEKSAIFLADRMQSMPWWPEQSILVCPDHPWNSEFGNCKNENICI